MWKIVQLWNQISARCLDYLISINKNSSHSFDNHFHNGVTEISCTVLPEMATTTSYINSCHQATLRFPKLQDQKSLLLHWRSFSRWGREWVTVVSSSNGGQYLNDGCLQPVATLITHDEMWYIIDTALMHIFRMGQGAYRCCFCL